MKAVVVLSAPGFLCSYVLPKCFPLLSQQASAGRRPFKYTLRNAFSPTASCAVSFSFFSFSYSSRTVLFPKAACEYFFFPFLVFFFSSGAACLALSFFSMC